MSVLYRTEIKFNLLGTKYVELISFDVIITIADEMEDSAETAGSSKPNVNGAPAAAPEASLIASLAEGSSSTTKPATAIDYDDENNLMDHARANAQAALEATRNKTKAFDDTYKMEQKNSKENYVLDDEDEDAEGEDENMTGSAAGGSGKSDPSMSKVNSELPVLLG